MKDISLLPALQALLEEGSVSGAARRMHLSTPAMSHTLARLRELTKDPLLVRAGRGMVATPRAQQLREPLGRALSTLEGLFHENDVPRELVVRAPGGLAIVFGALLFERLAAVMPRARLRLVAGEPGDAEALREGRVDLEITSQPPSSPEVVVQTLYTQRLVGAARPGHAVLRAQRAKAFSAARHVAQDEPEHPGYARELEEAGYRRDIVLRVPNAYAALLAAARSQLVAVVPESAALAVGAALGLKVFTLPLSTSRVVQAWHPRHSADPAHRALRELVHEVLARRRWQLSAMGEATDRPAPRAAVPRRAHD